jgi:predicted dehydrogenase
MDERLNCAIIGFGKLGLLHAGLVNGLPQSRLKAVADNSSTMLRFIRSKLNNVTTYKDYEEMLQKEDLDAVLIATPTNLHVPIALKCIKKGLPIFIEKPLSTRASDARELVEELKRKKVVNMVGYMGRFIDTFSKAKTILDSGVLGKKQFFRSSMYIGQLFKKGKGWRFDKEASGGGVLMTQNSHLLDKLLWFFGEIDCVSSHIKSLYSETVEDLVHAYISFKNGLTGYMDASWSARHYRMVTIQIHVQGENGTLDVNDDQIQLYLDKSNDDFSKGWSTWKKPDLYRPVIFDIGQPQYTRQAEEFLSAVQGKGKVDSDINSAYLTQCAVEAIYQSADNNGAPVTIKDIHNIYL